MPPSPVQTRAAHQLQQERFRLVVLRVPDGDPVRADVRGGALEERVAQAARGVFDRQRLGVPRSRGRPRPRRRSAGRAAARKLAAERLVPVGRWPAAGDSGAPAPATVNSPCSARSRSSRVSATESDPPDRPTRTRQPGGQEAMPADGAADLLVESAVKSQHPKSQLPRRQSRRLPWSLGVGTWELIVPEGGLEPPTPRL